MSFEVFMQVWCLQKSKLWWKQGKTGEKSQNRAIRTTPFRQLLGPFRSLPRVHFIHTIYRFEAREVRIPTLQTVSKSELKRKVMIIARKLDRAEREFRTPQSKVRKISHRAKPPPGTWVPFRTPQANFHTVWNKVQNSFQGAKISVQGASILHTTIQGAKFSF